ncbi:MAG: 2Fe-2S iron-sulfur cluster binding domain-containing protein [Nitrospirae bacterium]|nr:2Fe-2S iron-sulfur cluster binding domain-containing protein [Nitrospirota bacterium]
METKTANPDLLVKKKIQVTFQEGGKVPITVDGEEGQSILDVAEDHHIHLQHNCGGNCACTTCHVIVLQGMDHLSEIQEDEEDRLDKASGLTLSSRLGCQVRLQGGAVVVKIPD